MLSINPPTAGLLLSQFLPLKAGDWVVQNAGNSGEGRSVIAMARARGIHTVSIVRRAELIEELRAAGGDVVLVDSDAAAELIDEQTGGARIGLGLDGVGGSATSGLAQILTAAATIVNYADMGGQPVTLATDYLSGKNITLRGFFMYRPEFLPLHAALIATAARLQRKHLLTYPIAATYGPAQISQALQHTTAAGKVLLDLNPTRTGV
jgi:NADPH:quinone reductase-like Zn-dependent oxidoreductase